MSDVIAFLCFLFAKIDDKKISRAVVSRIIMVSKSVFSNRILLQVCFP